MCLEDLRGVTWAVCAELQDNKIGACDWQRDFCCAEELIVLSRCEKEPKSTQEGAPSWASPPVPSMEWVECSGAVEDCPLLVRIGGDWGEADGWVF